MFLQEKTMSEVQQRKTSTKNNGNGSCQPHQTKKKENNNQQFTPFQFKRTHFENWKESKVSLAEFIEHETINVQDKNIEKSLVPCIGFNKKQNSTENKPTNYNYNVIGIDIDNPKEDTDRLYSQLIQFDFIYCCYKSYSGRLRIFIKTEKEIGSKDNYRETTLFYVDYISKQLQYDLDKYLDTGKVYGTNLFYIGQDEKFIYVNEDCQLLPIVQKTKLDYTQFNHEYKNISKNIPDENKSILLSKLKKCNFENYDKWVHLGMALKQANFDIEHWQALSYQDKITQQLCDYKWNTFDGNFKGKKLTIGTLIYWVRNEVDNNFKLVNEFNHIEGTHDFFQIVHNERSLTYSVKIIDRKLINYANELGFKKLYYNKAENSIIVFVKNNIVKEVSSEKIIDHTIKSIEKSDTNLFLNCNINLKASVIKELVLNELARNIDKLFTEKKLKLINIIKSNFIRDSKDRSFFFFKNCFVEVTKKIVKLKQYSELEKFVWKDQIIDREFNYLPGQYGEFEKFLKLVSDFEKNNKRYNSLVSSIGYLTNTYKDPSNTKTIILTDEIIADNPSGRSGKSLIGVALSQIRRTAEVDGKRFDPKDRFCFQNVNIGDQIINIDDVKRNFNFESLFGINTKNLERERKNQDKLIVPFAESPKLFITCNYAISTDGPSADDRKFEIELTSYFNSDNKPIHEFGHRLFDDWSDNEWNNFDNYIIHCTQYFLENGLVTYDHINIEEKKFLNRVHESFTEWIEEIVEENIDYNDRFSIEKNQTDFFNEYKTLASSYKNSYKLRDFTKNKFTMWIKEYCKINNYKFELIGKGQNRRYIIEGEIKTVNETNHEIVFKIGENTTNDKIESTVNDFLKDLKIDENTKNKLKTDLFKVIKEEWSSEKWKNNGWRSMTELYKQFIGIAENARIIGEIQEC